MLIFSLFLLENCNLQERGSSEISENIAFSKKHNLFIEEYKIVGDTIKNPDAIDVVIEEAWMEKLWYYKPRFIHDEVIIKEGIYQLVLKIKNFNKEYTYNQKWDIQLINKKHRVDAEIGGVAIRGGLNVNVDTILIEVNKYKTSSYIKKKNEGEKIGEYLIVRK